VCSIAESNHLNMILIPWQHPKDASSALDYASNHQHHNVVVRHVLKKWEKSVAVILDRGIPVIAGDGLLNILVRCDRKSV
jgi:hypothetical protein